jgi:hypothetical protein
MMSWLLFLEGIEWTEPESFRLTHNREQRSLQNLNRGSTSAAITYTLVL